MFHSISWQQYSFTMGFLLAGYYAVVGWLHYKDRIRLGSLPFSAAGTGSQAPAMDLLHSVQQAMGALGELLETAALQKYTAEELLLRMANILAQYRLIKGSLFETTINQWLIERSAAACGINISAMEIRQCWP